MKKIFLYSMLIFVLISCKEDKTPNYGYAYYSSSDLILANLEGGDLILPIVTDQTSCELIPDKGSEWISGEIKDSKVVLHLEENKGTEGRDGTGYIFVGYIRLPFKIYQRSAGINYIEVQNPTDVAKTWTATCSDEQTSDGGGVNMIFNDDATKFWHSQYSPMKALPHWIVVDLKEMKDINKVRVGWRKYGEKYYVNTKTTIIQVSTDGVSFTDVGTIHRAMTNGLSNVDYTPYSDCSFNTVKARYVRLYMTESNAANGTCNVAFFKAYMP